MLEEPAAIGQRKAEGRGPRSRRSALGWPERGDPQLARPGQDLVLEPVSVVGSTGASTQPPSPRDLAEHRDLDGVGAQHAVED